MMPVEDGVNAPHVADYKSSCRLRFRYGIPADLEQVMSFACNSNVRRGETLMGDT